VAAADGNFVITLRNWS